MEETNTAEIVEFAKLQSRATREKEEVANETRDERAKRLSVEALAGATSAEEGFARLRQWSLCDEAFQFEAYDMEEVIRHGGNEVMRLLVEESIAARGSGDVGSDVIRYDQEGEAVELSPVRVHGWTHRTAFGDVDIGRLGYGAPGEKSLHPLDEDLNLPRRHFSYTLQKRAAKLSARGPFEEAVEEISSTTAAKIPKRQLEQIVEESAEHFEAYYEEKTSRLPAPEQTSSILSCGLDCKGVPRRKTEEERKKARVKHLGKGEKRQKKKMATVASVHTTKPHHRTPEEVTAALMDPGAPAAGGTKPRPEHRRLWASVRKSKDEVIQEVAREMDRRDPNREKTAVCVMDGERALRDRAVKYLRKLFPALLLILDIIHVVEYLWKAAHVFHAEGSKEARLWVRERLLSILRGNVSRVVAGMRQSATKRGLSATARKPVDRACNYFLTNKDRMRYDEYLRQGLPIASGAVEGACGHLVKDRMELTGAVWDIQDGKADAVLKLRALDKSGDFDDYWDFHMEKAKAERYWEYWELAS